MPISDYHNRISEIQTLLIGNTSLLAQARQRLLDSLRVLEGEIQEKLRESANRNDMIDRRIWQSKGEEVRRLISEFAADFRDEVDRMPRQAAEQVADIRTTATRALIREQGLSVVINFSGIPQQTMEFLAALPDVEGLKFSSNVWAKNQADVLLRDVDRQIATKGLREIAKGITQFVRGYDALTEAEQKELQTARRLRKGSLGASIRYKAERLIRTEVGNATWFASKQSSVASPVVIGIKWNLSSRHPKWDVCDILATQNLYGLGAGVYPADKLPVRPHPHDLCFQTDVLREPEQWNQPKPDIPLNRDVDRIRVSKPETVTPKGFSRQRQLAIDLIKEAA